MNGGSRTLTQSTKHPDYELALTEGKLCLYHRKYPQSKAIVVDFHTPAMRRRLATHNKTELLSRALGVKKWCSETMLIDLTAGLGTDAFLCASLGYNVLAIERQPEIVALLEDGLRHARAHHDSVAHTAARISVLCQDARDYLRHEHATDKLVQAIYLDPMFPVRRKSALGSLKLRALLALGANNEDSDSLLECARERANQLPQCERVVVKRPLHAPPLCPKSAPSHQIKGRSVRFDVYMYVR